MKKIKIVMRGNNSRRPFRRLNSETELVGQTVEITNDDKEVVAPVESMKIESNGDVTLELESGDEVTLDSQETSELLETGSVEEVEPKEFEVTREVVDSEGVPTEVTTKVEAVDEGEAIEAVKLVDSRRRRNSRNYRIGGKTQTNSRKSNSDFGSMKVSEIVAFLEENGVSQDEIKSCTDLVAKAEEVKAKMEGTNCDTKKNSKKFKVARKVTINGKSYRKIASVTAPSIEEAMAAVETKDKEDDIQAEGYEELVETEPKESVIINSDVVEATEIKDPQVQETQAAVETTEPAPAEPAPAIAEVANVVAEPIAEVQAKGNVETQTEIPDNSNPENPDPDVDRTSNSYKGVQEYVKRAYGIEMK